MSSKEYYKERRENLKAKGLCIQCGTPATGKVLCEPHYAKSKERTAKWNGSNREKVLSIKKSNYQRTKKHQADLYYKRTYGISTEDKWSMLREQDFLCPICRSDIGISDDVDHNKKTGEVRQILCGSCNRMIGLAQENIEILQSAINYL